MDEFIFGKIHLYIDSLISLFCRLTVFAPDLIILHRSLQELEVSIFISILFQEVTQDLH